MRDYWIKLLSLVLVFAGGFLLGMSAGKKANACEPCVQPEPQCGYEQVVNPTTGQLEQEYVCR